jgi:hypothetical protein
MKRRLTHALAAGALVAAMVPGAASAGPPIGGCPTGAWWRLILPVHQPQPADHNGDGWLCRLDLGGGFGFTFFDNVVRER